MDTKKLDRWASLLLDTGKRNNLVNFKDTKASTVEIILPKPEELFDKVESSASFEVFDPKIADDEDADRIFQILNAIVERSARYSAAILTACAIQTGKGKNAAQPICILCDGTTFFKTYKIKERVNAYLDEVLTKQLGINWNIVSCDNDITLGTAIAGLID